MNKIICVSNQKGGVGKTTTTNALAMGLRHKGYRVLCVDFDPQGNLSFSLRADNRVELQNSIYQVLKGELKAVQAIQHTELADVITSNMMLSGIELEFTGKGREFLLSSALKSVEKLYDYILIDAPPTLGGWVMNILCASDKVIIPVEASPWGMFGLANMFEFLNEVKQISPDLEVAGIAVTKVDTRKNYFKQTMETLHQLESIYVFEHVIRVDSSVEWSQDNSVPVVEYKKSSRSAKEYTELAEEVMNRVSR